VGLGDEPRQGEVALPIGLTLVRASEIYGAEPWFHELTAGIDQVVRPLGRSVLLRVLATREDELVWLRQWHERRAVAGVVLVDLVDNDPRVALVRSLGLPAVAVSSPIVSDGLPTVWTNDDAGMRTAVHSLHDLGHHVIGLVGGPEQLAHSVTRREAFLGASDELGLTPRTASGDYSEESGARAFAALLHGDEPPTAIVFDNDLMALGGLSEAGRLGRLGALSVVRASPVCAESRCPADRRHGGGSGRRGARRWCPERARSPSDRVRRARQFGSVGLTRVVRVCRVST
jgi:LacI family repressor for deo operon, udp, cdd, tsx, nupC, and nupG